MPAETRLPFAHPPEKPTSFIMISPLTTEQSQQLNRLPIYPFRYIQARPPQVEKLQPPAINVMEENIVQIWETLWLIVWMVKLLVKFVPEQAKYLLTVSNKDVVLRVMG